MCAISEVLMKIVYIVLYEKDILFYNPFVEKDIFGLSVERLTAIAIDLSIIIFGTICN